MQVHAMILARDEAANLADCISSLQSLATDITVFDTGSVDRTADLARSLGVRCLALPWQDHFGDARNEALRRLAGDWFLIVDADERLSENSVAILKSSLDAADAACDILNLEIRTYTEDVEQLGYTGRGHQEQSGPSVSGYVATAESRLLRAGRGLHYQGRVGERLFDGAGTAVRVSAVTHGVLHHLRNEESSERRARRQHNRLRLALREFLETGNPEWAALVGATLNAQQQWKTALFYLREAECSQEPGIGVHMQAGVARLHIGLLDGAIASFERAWRLLPEHPEVATWLSRAYLEKGCQMGLAEELLEGALEEAPDLDLAVVLMAQVHRRRNRLQEARALLHAILTNNPMQPLALKELGAVELLQGMPHKAEEHLRQALRLRPRDAQIFNNLACSLERQGCWHEALSLFTQAIALAGDESRFLRNRCIAQAACARWPQMCEDAESALLMSANAEEELQSIRERLLDGGWIEALQHLESWATASGWSRRQGNQQVEFAEETLEAI